jgi:hypothetical protein
MNRLFLALLIAVCCSAIALPVQNTNVAREKIQRRQLPGEAYSGWAEFIGSWISGTVGKFTAKPESSI